MLKYRAADRQTVYRICLREVPPALAGLRAGAVSVDDEAARLVQAIARPGYGRHEALAARLRIMTRFGASYPGVRRKAPHRWSHRPLSVHTRHARSPTVA